MDIVNTVRNYVANVIERLGTPRYLVTGVASLGAIIASGAAKGKNKKLSKVLNVMGTTAIAITAWQIMAPTFITKKLGVQDFYGTYVPTAQEGKGFAKGVYTPKAKMTKGGVTIPEAGDQKYTGGSPNPGGYNVTNSAGRNVVGFNAEDKSEINEMYPAIFTQPWINNDSEEAERETAYASRYVNDLFGRTSVAFKGSDLNIRDIGAVNF